MNLLAGLTARAQGYAPAQPGQTFVTGDCARPVYTPCIGQDDTCPCQDGDACHYRDVVVCGKVASQAFPLPRAP
jgi:hypothetical protein